MGLIISRFLLKERILETPALHRYSEGTGSVIQEKGDREDVYSRASEAPDDRVRVGAIFFQWWFYISPGEHLGRVGSQIFFYKRSCQVDVDFKFHLSLCSHFRLLGFPSSFSFPPSVGRRARYKALGNSLNVRVVALLLQHLIVVTSKWCLLLLTDNLW